MSKLFTFLKESDSESIRRSHRRRVKEIAISMSKKTSESKNAPTDTTMLGRSFQRGIEDNRPGYGPVSNTDGRQTPAVVGKLYLPSVGGGGYCTGPDGLIIATVFNAW